ncbi:MAG: hypothetical protein KAJ31_02895 [Deltaproteobacteria bacterium]|nr:hypothetical protein [Deltaproteobacteria bacterium]
MSRNVILIAVIIVIAWYFYMKTENKQTQVIEPDTTNQEISAQIDAPDSNSGNSEDKELIENLFKDGIISKIDEDGDTPKVYITADYYRIPSVDKTAIMKVLYKNFTSNNPAVTSFTVYDAKSGDVVGTYDETGFKDN